MGSGHDSAAPLTLLALLGRRFECRDITGKRRCGTLCFGDRGAGQRIRALVLDVASVALDPEPFDLMWLHRLLEPQPEIDVFDRFLVGRLPAARLPAMD